MGLIGFIGLKKVFLPRTDTDKTRTKAGFTTEPQRTQREIAYRQEARGLRQEETAMKTLPSPSLPRTRSGGEGDFKSPKGLMVGGRQSRLPHVQQLSVAKEKN
jgi:hypothetical protein